MSFKAVFLLCCQLLIQSIAAQCFGAPFAAAPLTAPCAGAWGTPYSAAEWAYAPAASLAASNGPGIAVSTVSPLIPAGVSVLSNNAYEGILAVGGAVPFLGAVAIEGALPTVGDGAIAYGCGNGAVGITAEDIGAVGFDAIGITLATAPLAVTPVVAAPTIAAPIASVPMAASPMATAALVPAALPFAPFAAAPCAEPWDASDLAASNGAGIAVSTVSPLIPAGVSVMSENAYEGTLATDGTMPFLGSVALEGALPTAGIGAVAYGCGNGAIGITAEDINAFGFPGIGGNFGYGAGVAGPMGITRPGCGFGVMY